MRGWGRDGLGAGARGRGSRPETSVRSRCSGGTTGKFGSTRPGDGFRQRTGGPRRGWRGCTWWLATRASRSEDGAGVFLEERTARRRSSPLLVASPTGGALSCRSTTPTTTSSVVPLETSAWPATRRWAPSAAFLLPARTTSLPTARPDSLRERVPLPRRVGPPNPPGPPVDSPLLDVEAIPVCLSNFQNPALRPTASRLARFPAQCVVPALGVESRLAAMGR
jgi:hypothetical protein